MVVGSRELLTQDNSYKEMNFSTKSTPFKGSFEHK